MAEKKELATAGKILIEISENDQIMALIGENTYKSSKFKKPETILKCLAMISSGTAKKVACHTTGLPYQTYVKWIHKPWYGQVMELIKVELDTQLDANLTGATHHAIEGINDRIQNGERVIDKDGVETRRAMTGRDLGISFATLFDRRQLLRNKPTSVTHNKSTKEHLDKIGERFAEFAEKDTSFIDAEFVEVDE